MAERPQGFARRMMAQQLASDARADPFSDSRFFSGKIRPSLADMENPTRFEDIKMPAYQASATGSLFLPGAGIADYFGKAPDPANPGQLLPGFSDNVQQGNYIDAAMQTGGAAGDVAMAAGALFPPAFPAAAALSTMLKGPRAARLASGIDNAVDATSSQANELLDDLPTLKFDGSDAISLEGKKIFPIVADLTKAGGTFEGIDSSKLDIPELLQGGPEFPNLKGSREAGVVWAVQGKGKGTQKLSKDADYGLVVAMNNDSHRTNATFVNAVVGNTLAYVRDGRLDPKNLAELNKLVRSGSDQKMLAKLKEWPGFESPEAPAFIKSLSFDQRKRLSDVVGSSAGQALGAPNIDKLIRQTADPNLLGLNSRDGILLVEIDKSADVMKLGTSGTASHASYDFGIKGKPIARIPPISAKNMFPDFFAKAEAEGKQNVRRAFDMALPVEELTPEKIENIRTLSTQVIQSPKQAKLTADVLTGNWKSSQVAKNKGGVSPADFVQNLRSSDASPTLSMMDLPEVNKKIRSKDFNVYQLGDGQVFFGLEKNYNYDNVYNLSKNDTYVRNPDGPELNDNEVALVSVINNETGAKGVGKSTVLKAIEEGATALDAFAVPTKEYSDGFLPDFYGSFGFEEVGRVDFDPSFYNKTELADLENYWRSTGWDESKGFPKIVVMKWTGDDGLRTNATKRFVSEGRFNAGGGINGLFPATEGVIRAGDGQGATQASGQRGSSNAARNNRGAEAGARPLAPDRLAEVARELLKLPDSAVQNLGIDPSRLAPIRNDLGIFR